MTPEIKECIAQLRRGEVPEGYKIQGRNLYPSSWKVFHISELCNISQGYTFKREYQGKTLGDWNYFKVADIGSETSDVYLEHAINKITNKILNQIGAKPFQAGSIIFPRVGAALLNDNKRMLKYDSLVDDNVLVLTMRTSSVCNNVFLYWILCMRKLKNWCNSGLVPVINSKTVLKDVVAIPSDVSEQIKIEKILTAQNRIIELKEKLIAEKQRQKKYLMQQLLTGKKRAYGFHNNWTTEKLSAFCRFLGGGTPDTKNEGYWKGSIPWISSSDLKENDFSVATITRFITAEAVRNSATKICPKGSILLVNRVGVGKLAIATEDICTSQDFINIVQSKHNNRYLMYALYWLLQKKIGQVQGSAIKGIPAREIKDYELCFPSLQEQNNIVNILTEADREIQLLQQDLEQEKKKKKALMQLLLTGIVRVQP